MAKIILKTVVFAVVILTLSVSASAEETALVNEIVVSGLRRVDEALVRAKISQQAGKPLSPEAVSNDIKAIYDTGLFEDVGVDVEMFEGGLRLIYAVTERPTLARVEFQGNEEFDDTKLQEQISLSTGASADKVLIKENAAKLRAFYSGEGYALASVVPVVRRIDNRIYLTYQITEGQRGKVGRISITGNKALSARKIKKAMKTSKWGWLSFITKKGYFDKAKLDADVEGIKNLYRDNGYMKAAVDEPEVGHVEAKWLTTWAEEEAPPEKRYVISIHVTEGDQYRISGIEFSGNKEFSDDELRKKTKSASGKVLSRGTLEADTYSMSELYADRGYAMINIYPDIVPDEARKQARVVFRINEGDIYKIGRVEISGNTKTRDKVIRREVRLNEGDRFSGTLLRRSYRNIINLNFFDDVNLKPEPDRFTKTLDLDIEVKEKPTGMLSVGGGYSSVDKWVGTVDFTEGNLSGRGQTLKAKGEFSQRTTHYELSFTEPWLFDRPVSATASVYNTSKRYIDYSKEATGFLLGFVRLFGDFWRSGLTYRLETAEITDIQETASASIKEQDGTNTTSSVTPSIIRDTRDNYLDPSRGSRNSISLTYAGLGGDNRFLKTNFDSTWFVPIGPTAISLRGRYGYAQGLFDKELPLYERYYVGGIYTVRGLGFGEAGPKGETGDLIGGTEEVIFNLEYIFPLIPEVRLKGVAFYDLGSAFDGGVKLDDLRRSTGLGLRWISPVGPLRLEWGYNLEPKPGERDSRWDFTIGTFF